MPAPKHKLCLCGHRRDEHEPYCSARCRACSCALFVLAQLQPSEHDSSGRKLRRSKRYGDKPGNLVERIGRQ